MTSLRQESIELSFKRHENKLYASLANVGISQTKNIARFQFVNNTNLFWTLLITCKQIYVFFYLPRSDFQKNLTLNN